MQVPDIVVQIQTEEVVPPKFVEYEGFLISEDGEIIGVVLPDGSYEMYPAVNPDIESEVIMIAPKSPWVPTTEADALWVMERRSDLRAKIERAKIQETEVIERMRAKKAKLENDLARFDRRFEPDLFNIAKKIIFAQKKGQTWATPYGSVAITNVGAKVKSATVEGVDEGTAKRNAELEALRIAWAKIHAPDAVVTPPPPPPRFMISNLTKERKNELIADPDKAKAAGFVVEPARVDIKINQ